MKPILVHVHIYYEFLWPELKDCLKNIEDYPHQIVVTLVKENLQLQDDILKTFPNAKIKVVENLGFDLGPFINVINEVNLDDYSYVIKLHTKRDIPTKDSFAWFAGPRWRNALLKFIKTKEIFKKVLNAFEINPDIGMHGPNISTFNKRCDDHVAYKETNNFISSYGLPIMKYKFVAGTMFMVRAPLLKLLLSLNLTQKDFEIPDDTHEGCQLAHKLERFCGYLVINQGKKIVDCTTNVFLSKTIYALLNLRKIVMTSILTILITKKNKLLIKVFNIPLLSIPLKKKD